MNRVSTAYAFQNGAADFMRAQSRHLEANQQASSGKRAVDLKGFGRQSETLIAARSVQARAEGFVEMHKIVRTRLQAQDDALGAVADAANGARQLLLSSITAGESVGMMSNLNSLFGQAVDALNWKHAGRYLFAGSQVDQKPVTTNTLAELAASTPGSPAFVNDQTAVESRLNETTSLTTGFLADSIGTKLFDVLKEIQLQHEADPFTGNLTEAQSVFLKSKLGALEEAFQHVLERSTENGLVQNRVDDATDTQSRRVTSLSIFIADVAEVDTAEALTRLQQAEFAIQASAAALRSLKENSLLNFLPV